MQSNTLNISVALFLAFASSVSAQSVGYIGAEYGNNLGLNPNDVESQESNSGTVSGAFAFTFGNATAVLEGNYRTDSYDSGIANSPFDVTPGPQSEAGIHLLFDVGSSSKLGGFAGYGTAPTDPFTSAFSYNVAYAGLEAVHAVNDRLTLFAQAGYGDNPEKATTASGGFREATFGRIGASYAWSDRTTVIGEAEYGGNSYYEDSDEPGDWWTVALSGETTVGSSGNLAITYGVRYASYDAINDPDYGNETSVNLGVRYMFGAGSRAELVNAGIVGLPWLPRRASLWTDVMN